MKRNLFTLTHSHKTTISMAKLYPIAWYEVLPLDSVQMATNMVIRCTPLLAPLMHAVKARIHHFFVPNYLIWEDFEDFITGGEEGTSAPTHPYKEFASVTSTVLANYLGVPVGTYSPNLQVSALPFRAYNTIWNEYYRDQQLQDLEDCENDSGIDYSSDTNEDLLDCNWEKDYLTSSRPDDILGTSISIPLSGEIPVKGIGKTDQAYANSGSIYETGGARTYDHYATSGNIVIEGDAATGALPEVYADGDSAGAVSISELRLAMAAQRFMEARNTYGADYVEYLRYLGVKGESGLDTRLRHPIYLGGGSNLVQFSEVLSHADSGSLDVGDMKGHGITAMRSNRFRKFFPVHGIVMSMLSVIPKAVYANALNRKFSRTIKEEYFQREFAHLGDQAVKNKEVYAEDSAPDDTFGYQWRYDEYRQHPSIISGDMDSDFDHFHLARNLSSDPALNSSFITCSPAESRVFASTASDTLIVDAKHSIQARRAMPVVPKPRFL